MVGGRHMNSMEAYLTTIVPGQNPCLHLPLSGKKLGVGPLGGFGVLGAVSRVPWPCLAALEAVKLITGLGDPLLGQLLTMDLARGGRVRQTPPLP